MAEGFLEVGGSCGGTAVARTAIPQAAAAAAGPARPVALPPARSRESGRAAGF